jgi:Lipopolysaccharide-assembly
MKFLLVIFAAFLTACGYRVAGTSDLLPPTLHTVSIPAFGNGTARYKITDVMPEAFAREFIAHTRYKVVSDPTKADMVLNGTILRYSFAPTVFDPITQRANVADLYVTLQLSLVERATGKILYQRPSLTVKETYQISADPVQYFGEDDIAVRRASERVAQQVVTSILENF